jgi:hypothetical protein
VTELAALKWCREHHALVRFESDGTVSVKVNDLRRRRPTFCGAVVALKEQLERLGVGLV